MKKQQIKIYDNGTEFLDDVYGEEKLNTSLNADQFNDFIYYDIDSVGKIRIEQKKYNLLNICNSKILYAISTEKTLYGWYLSWCDLTIEL